MFSSTRRSHGFTCYMLQLELSFTHWLSSLKTLSISERNWDFSWTNLYGINHFYFDIFSTERLIGKRELSFMPEECFWSTFTLCWHHPDLNFPLATSWRFHRTKAGGWHLTWCESSFYCIYSPNLSLLLNKKNIPRMDVMNTWLDLCISFKNFVLTLPFFLTVHI